MINNSDVVNSLRMGGEVHRYHTWPTIRRQTVADHTFNVIRIYWEIYGSVPSEVTAFLLMHDICEVRVGDPPHPIKLDNPDLKQIYDRLEDETLERMIGEERAMNVLGSCTAIELVRMKSCDLLEMAEFAAIELNLGNRYALPIFEKVARAVGMLSLDELDQQAVLSFMSKILETTR